MYKTHFALCIKLENFQNRFGLAKGVIRKKKSEKDTKTHSHTHIRKRGNNKNKKENCVKKKLWKKLLKKIQKEKNCFEFFILDSTKTPTHSSTNSQCD